MSFAETRVEDCELPETWGSGRLDEVCHQMKQGKILPQKEIHKTGSYPVFGANGCIGYCENYFLEEQRVLITCRGSTCGVINRSPPRSFVTNNAMILFEKDSLDNDFLFFALQEFSTKGLKTGSGQPQLTQGILNSHAIPLPPFSEQQKIAHILSTVQRAVEAQERIVRTTTELKKALIHKFFTEGVRNEPQKQTEIGQVPESWKVVEFDRFSTLQRGKDLTKTQFQDGNVPVAGSNGVIGFHSTATCVGPGVTVGRSGSAGKVIFYAGDFWAHNTSLYVRDFHGNDPRYVAYFLEHLDLARFKTGASVPTLDRNSFKNMPVPVPSVSEQAEIAGVLVTADRKAEIATRKRGGLQGLFRNLLHELMTAKTRVHELEITA